GLDNQRGLTTTMIEGKSLADVAIPTRVPNLSVVVSGPLPPNHAELAASRRMHDLMEAATRVFDLIVIDTPPVLSVSDAVALAATLLRFLLAALAWVLGMVVAGRLEWRRTALDRPVGLLIVLIATQLVLGPGPLLRWALASPESAAFLPARFLFVGTVSPGDTTRALLLFLTYVGVYAVVVNVVRRRADVERLVRILLVTGGVVAFASLVDFLAREDWVFRWRAERLSGRLTGP